MIFPTILLKKSPNISGIRVVSDKRKWEISRKNMKYEAHIYNKL